MTAFSGGRNGIARGVGTRRCLLHRIIAGEFGSNFADFGNDLRRELLERAEKLVGLFLTEGGSQGEHGPAGECDAAKGALELNEAQAAVEGIFIAARQGLSQAAHGFPGTMVKCSHRRRRCRVVFGEELVAARGSLDGRTS